jgi:hypothetical protein
MTWLRYRCERCGAAAYAKKSDLAAHVRSCPGRPRREELPGNAGTESRGWLDGDDIPRSETRRGDPTNRVPRSRGGSE